MSFRDLLDGDCGGANALVRLGSQVTRDATFKDAGISGPPGAMGSIYGSTPMDSQQMVNEFLQQQIGQPQSFNMRNLIHEAHDINRMRAGPPPPPFSGQFNHQQDHVAWGQQFENQQQNEPKISEWNYDIEKEWNKSQDVLPQQTQHKDILSPKEADAQAMATAFVRSIDDPQFANTELMSFMGRVADGDIQIGKNGVTENTASASNEWASEFSTHKPTSRVKSVDWAQQFEDERPYEEYKVADYSAQYWKRLQKEWLDIVETSSQHPWLSEFSDYYEPYKEYAFIKDNPMQDAPNPLELGKLHLNRGDIPSAVLCFEAAAKRDPDSEEVWQLLGTTQAGNEQDPYAIAALRRCLELGPNNLTALMALAVSYTNENYQLQASNTLVLWLKANPQYNDLVPPKLHPENKASSLLNNNHHREVQNLFLRAVQRNPQNIDPDLQGALGVLFHLSSDYDKAADCFVTALQAKPDDFRLWNRLGATLANGNRSEEAVDAYHRALELQPGFIRARYNVGITCVNLESYKEAAEHLLTALNQQAKSSNNPELASVVLFNDAQMSDTIWSTMKMVCSLLHREDLQDAVDARDLKVLNRAFNMD